MAPQQKLDWARVALSEPVLTEDAEHALLTLEQDDVVGTNARAVLCVGMKNSVLGRRRSRCSNVGLLPNLATGMSCWLSVHRTWRNI